MAVPVDDSYSVASGAGIYGGKYNSVIGAAAFALAVGDFVEISANNLNVKIDGETRYPNEGQTGDEFTDWAVSGVYDADRHRVYIAGSPANTLENPNAAAILRLDIRANSWDAIRNPWGVSLGHCYDGSAYSGNVLYKTRFYGDILRYDMSTETPLAAIPNPPTTLGTGSAAWGNSEGMTFHPNMGAQGSMIWCNYSLGRNCRYDLATETWSILNQTGNIASVAPVAHYSSVSDKVIYGIGRTTDPLYMADASATVTATDNCPDNMYAHSIGPLFAADPNTANSILITNGGNIYSLSHITGAWTLEGTTPAHYPDSRNQFRWIAPLDHYGVFLIVDYASNGNSKTYLYRYSR